MYRKCAKILILTTLETEGIKKNEIGSVSVKTHGAISIYLDQKAFNERDLSGIEGRIL